MATDSGSSTLPGGWSFPADLPQPRQRQPYASSSGQADSASQQQSSSRQGAQSSGSRKRQRHWKPRTCRICFETVLPTYHPPSETIPGIFQPAPNVTYESEEGRLIRPCHCKGSQRYVHEGCLAKWRHSDPSYRAARFWQCPTCKYKYRLARLSWGRWMGSLASQLILTTTIFILVMFVLGFIADPIIDFCLDPYGYFLPSFSWGYDRTPPTYVVETDPDTWLEHFLKGFASLGMIGFLKVMFSSPIRLFFRSSWGSGRGRTTGRDRLNQLSWIAIVIGALTFLYALWKGVRAWSLRFLEKAGERVMDVQGDDDDDDDDD